MVQRVGLLRGRDNGLFGRFLTVLHLRDRKGRGAEGGTAVPALRLRGPWRKGPDVELWEPKLLTSEIREEEAGMRNLFGSDSEEYAERTGGCSLGRDDNDGSSQTARLEALPWWGGLQRGIR